MDWNVNDCEKYDFLAILNEEDKYENHQLIVTSLYIKKISLIYPSFFLLVEDQAVTLNEVSGLLMIM